MTEDRNFFSFEEMEIEPITDEILQSVLGGLGDEDSVVSSCSATQCSNRGPRPKTIWEIILGL
jgi:hypothetical protein